MKPDRFRLTRLTCAALVVALLAGCALGRPGPAVKVIAPEVDSPASAGAGIPAAVAVVRPQTDRTRDSDRILVRKGHILMPYAGAVWLDRMPDMVQALLVESLDGSGGYAAVGRHGDLRADYRLITEIRRFEALDVGGAGLTVHLEMQTGLVAQVDREIIDSRRFSQRVPVSGKSLDALVAGFEQAMTGMFAEVNDWALETAGQRPE